MNPPTQDPTRCLRRQAYWLMIAVAAAIAVGHVLSTERVYEPSLAPPPGVEPDGRYQAWPQKGRPRPMPTFGSNDRSRWDTVRRWWTTGRSSSAGAILPTSVREPVRRLRDRF